MSERIDRCLGCGERCRTLYCERCAPAPLVAQDPGRRLPQLAEFLPSIQKSSEKWRVNRRRETKTGS